MMTWAVGLTARAVGYVALVLVMASTPPGLIPQTVAVGAVLIALAAGYTAGRWHST